MRWMRLTVVKILLALLASVGLLIAVASTAGAIFFDQYPTYEEEMQNKYRNISKNYGAAALDKYSRNTANPGSYGQTAGTNFCYLLVESTEDSIYKVNLKDPSIYLVGKPQSRSLEEYTVVKGREGYRYNYYVGKLSNNMYRSTYAWCYDPYSGAEIDEINGEETATSTETDASVKTESRQATYYYLLGWAQDPLDMSLEDQYVEVAKLFPMIYKLANHMLWVQILSVIITLVSFVLFLAAAGMRPEDNEVHLRIWDRMPFAIYSCGWLGLELAIGACAYAAVETSLNAKLVLVLTLEAALAMCMLGMAYLATFTVRIKAHCFWRHTIVYYIARGVGGIWRFLCENVKLMGGLFLIMLLLYGAVFILASILTDDPDTVFVSLLLSGGLLFLIASWCVTQLKSLQKGGQRIATGHFEEPVNTDKLHWEFRRHGENLNSIRDGISSAVDRQMKSEHLRTELITNVSHDIKTPLTSIISYVDLLEKQNIEDPQAREYLEVLDRQSARLKKLIEDLMEASKASTGNLEVNMEPTDAAVLLEQAAAEFEERLEAKGLQLIIETPESPVEFLADGRHLWRVFDNLLGNICKYAMEGSRVYITIKKNKKDAQIIFRNISAYQLNISPDELMERFVRGDSSRHTEGSGLGLSIAQSLTNLMNGSLQLDIDGDLFKVTLRFPL